MKKTYLLVSALMLFIFVTGCAGSNTSSGQKNPEAKTEGKTEAVNYPTKKIEIIVPFAAGGGTDAVARVAAESLKSILNQEVIVVNRTGGSGTIGLNEGLNAKADGYTLTMVTREVVSLPLLGMTPFATNDFKYVANLNIDPAVLVVASNSKYKTLEDLLEDLHANPGKLKFAASVVPNYYGIQFSETAGVEFATIPYQGGAPAITELLGGGADFGIYGPGEVKGQVEGGNLLPLAVMAEERHPSFQDTPTFKEKGLDIISGTYRGIAVPPATPDEVVNVLEDALAKVAEDSRFIDFMNKSSLGIGYKNSQDFKALIEEDIIVLEPIIEIAKQEQK